MPQKLHERLFSLAEAVEMGALSKIPDGHRAIFEVTLESLEELLEEEKVPPLARHTNIREDSGNVDSADPWVAFLYHVMRDAVVPGAVARAYHETAGPILEAKAKGKDPLVSKFSNGWLARYAHYVVKKLREVTPEPAPLIRQDADVHGDGSPCPY